MNSHLGPVPDIKIACVQFYSFTYLIKRIVKLVRVLASKLQADKPIEFLYKTVNVSITLRYVQAISINQRRIKLAFHDAYTDTDTDFLARQSRVSDGSGEPESVSVSASWNASLNPPTARPLSARTDVFHSRHRANVICYTG